MPVQIRAPDEASPRVPATLSIGFAAFLVMLLFGFIGLLGYGRAWLAQPLRPELTVYLALMIGLTVGVWVLTLAYVLLTSHTATGAART